MNLPRREVNSAYFILAALFFQIVYVAFVNIVFINKGVNPLVLFIIVDFISCYIISMFLVKVAYFQKDGFSIKYPTRFFSREYLIKFTNVKRVYHQFGGGAGDMPLFWIHEKKGFPTLITFHGNMDEIKFLIKLFEENNIPVKIRSRAFNDD